MDPYRYMRHPMQIPLAFVNNRESDGDSRLRDRVNRPANERYLFGAAFICAVQHFKNYRLKAGRILCD